MRTHFTIISAILFLAGFASAADPKDLLNLRDSWTRTRNQATAPIDKKYVDALELMKRNFTREGNLEAALAVDAEIKKVNEPAAASAIVPPADRNITQKQREAIEQGIRGTSLGKWNMPNGGWGQFEAGPKLWSLAGVKSKYAIEKNGEILITDEVNKTARLKLSDDQIVLSGTWFDGSQIELKRRP